MPKQSFFKKFRQSRSFLLIALTVFVLLILLAVSGPGVFNSGNITQIMNMLSYKGLFIGATACLLLGGGIDFSLGSQATFGAIIFVQLFNAANGSVHWLICAVAALAVAAVMGLINAFFTQKLNIMPFICTIGMSSVWIGIANWYLGGSVKTINDAAFSGVAAARVFGSPIPWTFVFMAAIIIFYGLLIRRTSFGRSVLVSGGNPAAARLAGLNTKKIKTILYINASVMGMIGGLVYTSQLKTATTTGLPQAAVEMNGLSASLLGGVSFMGGAGGIGGAFFGIVLIQVLEYSLQIMTSRAWLVQFVNGMLLVIALTIDTVSNTRRLKKLGIKASGGMVMPGMAR